MRPKNKSNYRAYAVRPYKTMKPKKIKNVYLVYKRSVYQKYYVEEDNPNFRKLFHKKHLSVSKIEKIHEKHMKAVRKVQRYLKKNGLNYKSESRHQLSRFHDIDLIITLGGDGTFLRTAHYIDNQLILPINSDPEQSVGALCSATIDQFTQKMDEVLKGNYKIKKLPSIVIKINGHTLPVHAVNDVLFTNNSPAATSRYFIKMGRTIEEHKSSGVWISTAIGSTAAISAAGGEKMDPHDKRLQFATREPYQGNFYPYKLTHGYIEKGKKLTIINKMMEAKIYIDGPTNSFDMKYGDEVSFQLSKKLLKVVV